MLDSMRKPFLVVALILILLVVLVELGSMAVLGRAVSAASGMEAPTPGKAIPALAILDGLILFATLVIAIALLIPERVQSKIQGIVTVIVSTLLLLGSITTIVASLALLILMVTLLMAIPFGTIAYFVMWANFDTGGARIALSLIMALKIAFAGSLVAAQQRFLGNKGFVLIILTSLASNLIIVTLHGLVPGFLVSITDDVAAIVVCILAAVWAAVYLTGGVVSVVKAVA